MRLANPGLACRCLTWCSSSTAAQRGHSQVREGKQKLRNSAAQWGWLRVSSPLLTPCDAPYAEFLQALLRRCCGRQLSWATCSWSSCYWCCALKPRPLLQPMARAPPPCMQLRLRGRRQWWRRLWQQHPALPLPRTSKAARRCSELRQAATPAPCARGCRSCCGQWHGTPHGCSGQRLLFDAIPGAALLTDKNGDTALHFASDSAAMTELLLQHAPPSCCCRQQHGCHAAAPVGSNRQSARAGQRRSQCCSLCSAPRQLGSTGSAAAGGTRPGFSRRQCP